MLNTSIVNPYIRVAKNSVLPKKHVIKRRIIFDYELIYIADGEFIFTYDDVDYKCKAGTFIFIRPNIPHSFSGINNALTQPHIHFDITHISNSEKVPISFKDRDALTDYELTLIRNDLFTEYEHTPLITFKNKDYALNLFYQIIFSEKNSFSALYCKSMLIQLIDLLVQNNFQDLFKNENHFIPVEKQIKSYIDSNQCYTVNLDELSKYFNYSKYYLDHVFQNRYHIGIIAYRNQKRMQMAKEMLNTNSVTEVSEKLEFSSIYVFSRAFKNHFGISPNDFKRQNMLSHPKDTD